MIWFIVIVGVIALIWYAIKNDANNASSTSASVQRSTPPVRKIRLSSDAYEMVGQFAQLSNAVLHSQFFYPSEGFDTVMVSLWQEEGESYAHARLGLYTDCNLRRVAEYSHIELDESQFVFDSDNAFLKVETDSVTGLDEWLGISTSISILGREQLAANPKSVNVGPLVATLQNNIPGATQEEAKGGFYINAETNKYSCSFHVKFKLHR